ncbi:hypothetical protein OG800_49800 (plasmid) [Streptomyces sp. NBC_00445]|uniref:hypothetical protein n=1 Tax=Streptomyces sp. NBC_00445 TaxID=2975745 RepID=UPI002E24A9A9
MAVVALVSGKSSGVTCSSLALALSSPRPSLLVEADPAGGTIRAGYLGGEGTAQMGLHRLASADRQGTLAREFRHHWVSLDKEHSGNRMLLPGLTAPTQAASMSRTWASVAELLAVLDSQGFDVLIDAGRVVCESETQLSSRSYPAALLRAADAVLLVVRSTQASVVTAAPAARVLKEDLARRGTGADALGLLVIEEGSASTSNVQQWLQTPVVCALAWDPDTADVFTHGQTRLRRTTRGLLRSARSAHDRLQELVTRRRVQLYPAHRPATA